MARDLANLKPKPRTLEILHPATGANLGVRMTVVSVDDDRLRKVKRDLRNKRLALEQRGKSFTAKEEEENMQDLLIAACIGWEWYNPTGSEGNEGFDAEEMPEFEGEVPQFNPRNFKRVVEALPWFGTQISAFISETKDFFDNSEKN